jgi:hypothetical protein
VLIIEYEPIAFPERFGQPLSEPDKLRCSWAELVWATMMAGRQNLRYVIQPDTYSYLELVYRATTLYENLQAAEYRPGLWGPADTALLQSPAYRGLDPAQKAIISYLLGLGVAKLFSAKLLGVGWLSHGDSYQQRLEPESLPEFRPDFIGLHPELGWLVMEVKGRSHWLDRRVLHRAKKRAQQLGTIGGRKASLQIGFCSYFAGKDRTLKVYLEDPPIAESPVGAGDLVLSPQDYLLNYYHLLLSLLSSDYGGAAVSIPYGQRTYRVKRLEEADLRLGLDEQVYTMVQSSKKPPMKALLQTLAALPAPEEGDEEQVAIARDGVYLQLGQRWHPERMALPPGERS